MRQRGRRIEVNGLSLNVVDEGDGPPVLLLHGFPDSADLWREVAPHLLRGGFRVIAPDLRGFGNSDAPGPTSAYRLPLIVADVLALLAAKRLQRIHVIGHDWGALLGWMLAGEHPDRVHRYVAVSVGHLSAYRRAGIAQQLRAWYVAAFQLRGLAEAGIRARSWTALRTMSGNHPEVARWIGDLARPGRLTAGLAWYRANLAMLATQRVPKAQMPVLGVWSPGDVALVESQMRDSSRYVAGPWRYQRIENASHWIPLDQPERLAALALEWFKGEG